MDDDYPDRRDIDATESGGRHDVDADIGEITRRLGDPLRIYETNPASVAWRFSLGLAMVLAGAALNYLVWTGEVPWPKWRHFKLILLLIAGMVAAPGAGLYLIYFAVRGRKMWVLDYPTGLFVWHRGAVAACPWDEIRAVQLSGLPDKAVLVRQTDADGLPECLWFDLAKSAKKLFGTSITITRSDGEQVDVSSILGDFAALGERIQQETFRHLFPRHWASFQDMQTLSFGAVEVGPGGISVGKDTLRWPEVDALERVSDKLEVKQVGKKKAWKKVDLNEVVNLHVLMGVVQAKREGEGV
ncbi:MAG TPA: DUF6585 family protein [Gemmataceae bacterium]|nr:DUF6585 family protein [Gemmataceae bacterium]